MLNMAWEPTDYLIKGELDDSVPGEVKGWIGFAGMDESD